jgi:hypothetical protein
MTLSTSSINSTKFCKTHCAFQRTFVTPLRDLDAFVAAILSGEDCLEEATVIIDQVVFEPKNLNALLLKHALPAVCGKEASFGAKGTEEIYALLRAALSDWVDFLFIPKPKAFLIYADHDEYTTFFGSKKSNSSRIADRLLTKGFKEISDWQRTF